MALPSPEDHTDQAEQLTLLSPEELTQLRCSVSSQPPARKPASSKGGGVRKPRSPKDGPVQDELPFL
jgi:hypothetical protein